MAVEDRFIRIDEMQRIFGWSRSTIVRKVKDKILPPPVKLGPNSVAWRESQINAIVLAMNSKSTPKGFVA